MASASATIARWPDDPHHPRHLIPALCRQFYTLKWVTGTGGGIAIKHDNTYYLAPSGVQKERIQSDDLFVLRDATDTDTDTSVTTMPLLPGRRVVVLDSPPPDRKFTPSQCTPLFYSAFDLRSAGACIHTHSQSAVLITLLYDREFRITHQEMIKGIKIGSSNDNYSYYDELAIPIIDNTPHEKDLTESLQLALEQYPDTNAVLVRRHGVYVWGKTWEKAKTMCECYDYLFEIAVQMKQLGIEPDAVPHGSRYAAQMKRYPSQNAPGASEYERAKAAAVDGEQCNHNH